MKQLILLIMSLIMVLAMCACSGSQPKTDDKVEDASVQVGDILDAPEITVSFDDLTSISFNAKGYTTLSNDEYSDEFSMNIIYAFNKTDSQTTYWTKTEGELATDSEISEPYLEEFFCSVIDGKEYASMTFYDTADGSSKSTQTAVDGVLEYLEFYEIESNQQYVKEGFAYYGIDYKNAYDRDVKFKKCADETLNGFDCYVYNIVSDDNSISKETIYVDKKTGLWIKDEVVWTEADDTYTEVFEITSYSYDTNIPSYDISEF